METDLLSNSSEIAAPKLMKNAESTFFYLLDRWPCGLLKGRIIHFSGLGWSLFLGWTNYERVFAGDIYGDHVVSCAGIIGIKHRHNVARNTLVDICYRSGILAGLDVCVDLTGSSPLTQIGMADFVPDLAVIDAAQRKRDTYMANCAAIGYEFLPFSFSSLGDQRQTRLHC
ncbi:hypothetical protein Tco_1495237 [Tanacetum coccineum]